jgi:hypothetical protein
MSKRQTRARKRERPSTPFHAPRLHLLERAHEHFVAAKGVRAVLGDDIRVDR